MGTMDGKVAIVSGASRGIGRDIALVFGREGAKTIVAARTMNPGDFRIPGTVSEAVEKIKEEGGEAIGVRCDVSSDEEMENLIKTTIDTYGKIDVLVNNGAIRVPGTIPDMQTRHWDLIFRVNVRGPFILSRLALPHMIGQGGGHIINVTSGAARSPGKGPYTRVNTTDESYGITKAALDRMSQGLASEVWDKNISVNLIHPGVGVWSEGGSYFRQDGGPRTGQRPNGFIFGDAIAWISNQDPKTCTGNLMTAEEYITMAGGNLDDYPKVP